MGVWTELVGVRKDLRLRAKWWHHVAVGVGVFTALLVYLIVAGIVLRRPPRLTTANTFSETLLHEATARQKETTALSDLDALGLVGNTVDSGDIVPLPRPAGDDVRCEGQPRYKAGQTVKVGGIAFAAIPDHPDQPPSEGRHCVATAAYAGRSADSISVFRADGTGNRKLAIQAFLAGIAAVSVWLVLYWNVYYRGLMPIYAKRRQLRKRRHFERQSVR
jgi:hypothetical protein